MLDASNVGVLNPAEVKGLIDWSSSNAASKADFRYSGDVSRNWCITNLKNAFYETYKITAEDAGKLDHDPVLNFPNGAKTRLSRFIGDERFNEVAEKGAQGKDFADVKAKDVKIAGVKRKTA